MKRQDIDNTSDKDKKDQNKNYSELFWNLALIMLIPMWIGIAPVWNEWFSKDGNGLFLKNLYTILDGRWLVNIPICLFCIFGTMIWCCKIWKDHSIRFHRPLLIGITFVFLLDAGGNVTYAKVVCSLNYRKLFLLLLTAVLITIVVKTIKQYFKKKKETTTTKIGFSDDNLDKELPETLQNYAKEIVERLLATDLTMQAYAVGITGEWGVGKTTFLNTLKNTISEKAEVVEFNPWMCRTPEQVINDFFSSLRHQLSPKYSTLSRSLREYAKYVGSLSVKPTSKSPFNFSIPIKQDSLFERKKSLSAKFKKLPRPVAVIIDDIDRLASEEVFEVLRLIRNTADLSNIIYLVAYDKIYVTSVLKENNVKDSTAYLEKIFQVEVPLPKVENDQIWNTLYKEIEKQNPDNTDFPKELFSKFDPKQRDLILRILGNYRRAKRFARLYMLNVSYLTKQYDNELKKFDFFWLELLQMYDKRIYDNLSDGPYMLLYQDEERFKLRNGISNPASQYSQNKYDGDEIWKKDTPKILEVLFGENRKAKPQCICYVENYSKYFTLSISSFRLSISEMNQLFIKDANPEKIVETWLKNKKHIDSIAFQLKKIPVKDLDDAKLKAFLYGVLSFWLQMQRDNNTNIWQIRLLLRKERYTNEDLIQTIHDIITQWFSEKMSMDDKTLICLSVLLNLLYTTETVDVDRKKVESTPIVINNNEIEELLIEIMNTYLGRHPEITALELLRENGTLLNLFKNCCVLEKDDMSSNSDEYKQIVFDVVIDHFSQKEIKPNVQEYEDAIKTLFYTKPPDFDNQLEEFEYWSSMNDTYETNMLKYFGSTYRNKEYNKLEEFKTKCFDTGNKE